VGQHSISPEPVIVLLSNDCPHIGIPLFFPGLEVGKSLITQNGNPGALRTQPLVSFLVNEYIIDIGIRDTLFLVEENGVGEFSLFIHLTAMHALTIVGDPHLAQTIKHNGSNPGIIQSQLPSYFLHTVAFSHRTVTNKPVKSFVLGSHPVFIGISGSFNLLHHHVFQFGNFTALHIGLLTFIVGIKAQSIVGSHQEASSGGGHKAIHELAGKGILLG